MTTTIQRPNAPQWIAPDTYTGRWTRAGIPAGRLARSYPASAIAATAAEGVIWDSAGHDRSGREIFGRSRYVADAAGRLHVYDSNGRKVLVHPASRRIRILVTR